MITLKPKSATIVCTAMCICILSNGIVSAFTIPSLPSRLINQRSTSSSSTTTTTKLHMSLEPLAKEGSWTAYLDEETTGLIYYFNTITGESLWDPPTSTFPSVKISRRKEMKMASVRQEYNEKSFGGTSSSSSSSSSSGNDDGGFFSALFAPKGNTSQVSGSSDTTSTEKSAEEIMEEIKQLDNISKNAKEGTPLFNFFGGVGGGGDGGNDSSNASSSSKQNIKPAEEIQKETVDTNSDANVNTNTNLAASSFLNNLFGQQQQQQQEKKEQTETPIIEKKNENQSSINGAKISSTDTAVSAPAFLNNFFGQGITSPKVNNGKGKGKVVAPAAIEEEEEDDFYDQTLFEDAVATVGEPEVEAVTTPIKLEIASKIMPHPEKVSWGGEDALFVSGKSFGVFDGVSGAEKLDGLPLYSNTLAQQLKSRIGKKSLTIDEIKAALLQAAEYADMAATGASTAVVASVGEDDMLRALNLGDSVVMVVRDGAIKARVKETVHYFDCPYQLASDSPDRPKKGSVLETPLEKGDLIIAGSDGVFDNLGDAFLLEILENNNKGSISKLAQEIVSESRKISKDTTAYTPYAAMAKKNNYAAYSKGVGGKIDDISCIVVRCK